MQDRFRVRMFDKNIRKMWNFDNDCMLETVFECLKQQLAFDSGLEIFKPIAYDHISDGRIFLQCTGRKDKNGKLIYEGDILKGKKDMICSPHSSKMVDKVGVVEIPQNMFVARCRDVKNNCTLFCQEDWVKTEVIGNIYENKELLESEG